MKAIKITADNRIMLGDRYGIDDYEDVFPIGMYVVAPFGTTEEEYYEGIISLTTLNEVYVAGEPLENGFFMITER